MSECATQFITPGGTVTKRRKNVSVKRRKGSRGDREAESNGTACEGSRAAGRDQGEFGNKEEGVADPPSLSAFKRD